MINGKTISLSGEDFVLPPLNIATLKKHQVFFDSLRDGQGQTNFAVMSEIILGSIQRNYPDMTQARLDELLDIGNIASAFQAVMSVSGFEAASGEAPPGNP